MVAEHGFLWLLQMVALRYFAISMSFPLNLVYFIVMIFCFTSCLSLASGWTPNGTPGHDGSHLEDLQNDCWAGRISHWIDLSKGLGPCCLPRHRCRRSIRASWFAFVLDSSLLVSRGCRTLAFVGLAVVQNRKSVFSLEVVAGNCIREQHQCRHSIHLQVLRLCSPLRILESQAPPVPGEEAAFFLLLFLAPFVIWPPVPRQ